MEEKKQNICRPITFYNYYIPATGAGNKAEFCAFGIVDGIQVGEALTNKGSKRNLTDCIWEEQKKFYNELAGNDNAQRIYIVCYEEMEKEQEFWEGDELPFFFFCRIQCSGEKTLLMQDKRLLENLGSLDADSVIKTRIYLTYDNTDLFIVLRTSKYFDGAEIINTLHQGKNFICQSDHKCTLKNSFTIMAVRNRWISQLDEEQKREWNKDRIDRIYIRLIERNGGNIEKIKDEIERKIKPVDLIKWTVLGTDDEMLALSDVGWGDFLSLYEEENGIFGNRSEGSVYSENAAGVTSQICVRLKNEKKDSSNGQKPKSENAELFRVYVKKLKKKLEEINNKDSDYISELNIILNALPKFSGEMFNDYIFFPLLNVLDTLLELMSEQKKISSHKLDKEPFYDFLTGFCFYTQNTILTDRHTAQMLGFNVKIYDIPVKLNAFYNAYVYRITSILNVSEKNENPKEEMVSYDFFALPGMADFVKVQELYKGVSDKRRLIKIEIPEYSFYNTHSMMVILAHETAHYAGRDMRNRDYRTEAIISGYVHTFVKYIEKRGELKRYKKELWQECENRLKNLLYRCLQQELDEDFFEGTRNNSAQNGEYWNFDAKNEWEKNNSFNEKLNERKNKNIDYLSELTFQIHIVMEDILERNLDTIFTPILFENSNAEKIFTIIRQASRRFIRILNPNNATIVSSMTVLDSLTKLYEESFADLMSILILKMEAEEYITGIIEYAEYQGLNFKVLKGSDVILRISAVLGCFFKNGIGKGKIEVIDEWYNKLFENNDDSCRWRKVVQKAMGLWHNTELSEIDQRVYDDNVYCALIYDEVIIDNVIKYLRLCMEQFEKNYKNIFGEKVEEIRKLFQLFSVRNDVSAEKQIIQMVDFISSYKGDLQKKIITEENGDGSFKQ